MMGGLMDQAFEMAYVPHYMESFIKIGLIFLKYYNGKCET
jgi:hypothetical protein